MSLGSFCSKKENKFITIQPKSLRITGVQKGFLQCLEIYQSIQTEEDLDQVSYIFPTDNSLCIYNMKFQVGDEIITAKLQTQKAAKETFEEAKKIGRTAAMTEQIAPGITSVKIGNVPKNKIVSIIFQCAFMSILQNPTTILAKIPLQASEPDGSLTDLYNLPSLEINIDLNISQLQQISDVYTNCESNYTKIDDNNGKLTINSAIITDENILIMTELSAPVQSQIIQTDKSAVISVIPDFETKKSTSKEFVFLIDCSASMLGESIRKAKESLHLFLSKLSQDSYFNIICFGTTFKKLFDNSEKADQINIEKATTFINEIRANLGGTELLQLFDELFKNEVKIGSQRQIFMITDGEVFNRQKVIQKVNENSGFNRIFAIGLGHGADAGFLDEVCALTSGKSDFVFSAGELPAKVAEQLELALGEAAASVEVHAEGGGAFEVAPFPLPPLLPRVVRHVFLASCERPVESAMVSGRIGASESESESEVECVVSLAEALEVAEGEKSPVFALFAQVQMRKVEEDEDACVRLSLASGVMCKHTSYVAVSDGSYVVQEEEPSETPEHLVEAALLDAPRMAPMCFASCAPCCMSAAPACLPDAMFCAVASPCYAPVSPSYASPCLAAPPPPPPPPCGAAPPPPCYAPPCPSPPYLPPPCGAAPPPPCDEVPQPDDGEAELAEEKVNKDPWSSDPSVSDVVRLQSRDGFWDLPSAFVSAHLSGGGHPALGPDLSESPIVRKRVASTVLALGYLSRFFASEAGRWRFAREKGLRWLKKIAPAVDWGAVIAGIVESVTK